MSFAQRNLFAQIFRSAVFASLDRETARAARAFVLIGRFQSMQRSIPQALQSNPG